MTAPSLRSDSIGDEVGVCNKGFLSVTSMHLTCSGFICVYYSLKLK